MEYKMKCNVCGKVFCYTDEDLKKNASNAGLGALSALGSLASTLGGGTIFHTHHLQGQADRYTAKIVDYNQCPYCHSRSLSVFTGNAEEDAKVVKAVNINTSASTESLLKRVFIFLEDGEWETADAYCEACLDKDPESAKAYLGKLMAELHVKIQGELKNQPKPFDSNANYRKAIRYGDDELRNTLIGYTKYINNRNENTRKDKVLRDAKSRMTGKVISNYEEALSLFASIAGWKDADEQKSICLSKIAELKAKEEADRLERERLAKEEAEAARVKANKQKKVAAIVVPILVVLIAATVIFSSSARRSNAYENGLALMDAGQYAEAIQAFTALGDYKDCAEQIQIAEEAKVEADQAAEIEAKYNTAIQLLSTDSVAAYELLLELGDYKDAQSYLDDFQYLLIEESSDSFRSGSYTYRYDSHGRLISRGNYVYIYDNSGKLLEEGDGWNIEYEYSENGSLEKVEYRIPVIDSSGKTYYSTINCNEDGYPISIKNTHTNFLWKYQYNYADSDTLESIQVSWHRILPNGYIDNEADDTIIIDATEYACLKLMDEPYLTAPLFVITSEDGTEKTVYELTINNSQITIDELSYTKVDEHGNPIVYRTKNLVGREYTLEYENIYDESGNLIKVVQKSSTSDDIIIYEYTYGYVYCPDTE